MHRMIHKQSGSKRLRQNISGVEFGVFVDHLDDLQMYLFNHKINSYRIMLHSLKIPAKILRQHNHRCIVSKHYCRGRLRESEFFKEQSEPQDVFSRFNRSRILRFSRREGDI